MISLQRVTTQMALHYYDSLDNYYTRGEGIENSEWYGQGARLQGLEGQVDAASFGRLIQGRSKDGSLQMVGIHKRAGTDATLSAPKSVSLALLVGGDERLETAHKEAVREAVQFAEERLVQTRVHGARGRVCMNTGNATVALFHHDSSRALDPQLHTHAVFLNRTRTHDRRWRSLHNDEMFRHSKLIGLIYQNELARRVQKLGYEIEAHGNGTFELAGFTRPQIEEFSRRTLDIEALRCSSKKKERIEKLKNRPAKGKSVARSDLVDVWLERAVDVGIEFPKPKAGLQVEKLKKNELAASAVRHASEKKVQFSREEAAGFLLQTYLGKAKSSALLEIADSLSGSPFATKGVAGHVSVKEMELEKELLAFARLRTDVAPICPDPGPQALSGLSSEQKRAVEGVLKSTHSVNIWHGVAGAGKTFALARVKDETRRTGAEVVALAPSAQAAKVLSAELGVQGATVASYLRKRDRTKGALLIVDEAGFLSNRAARDVLRLAEKDKCRVLFVGDTRQLPAVEAGNPFAYLRANGVPSFELKRSRRQELKATLSETEVSRNEKLKAAIALFNKHKTRQAALALEEFTEKVSSDTVRMRRFAQSVTASILANESTLALVQTRAERDEITEKVRLSLRKAGRLGADVSCEFREDSGFSREEVRRMKRVPEGYGLLEHLKDSLYKVRRSALANGDLVVFTENNTRAGYRNGTAGQVESITSGFVTIKAENQRFKLRATKPLPLRHGYVSTVHAAQGASCDRVLLLSGSEVDSRSLYVAVSRARQDVRIFAPEKSLTLKHRPKEIAHEVSFEGSKRKMVRKTGLSV